MTPNFLSIQTCPFCSRAISFQSAETTIIECSCGKVLQKATDSLVIAPAEPVTKYKGAIQPGTTGTWQNKSFTVAGRFRAWFDESVFNYWTIIFSDGEIKWLAEGYGMYAILSKAILEEYISSQRLDQINTAEIRKLDYKNKFILKKVYETKEWDIEGEVFMPQARKRFRVFEFSSEQGRNVAFFEFERDRIATYDLFYISFQSLELKNLRSEQNEVFTLTCSSCKTSQEIKNYPFVQSFGCINCGSFYTTKQSGVFTMLGKSSSTQTPDIPLGSRGKIFGIQYEIVGYARKEEEKVSQAQWNEYTLYNPVEGFAFLSEYNGNWIYLRETNDSPTLLSKGGKSFEFNGEPFLLFNAYTAKVVAARGEFPYNVFDNRKTKATEYISPPEMWVEERDAEEGITWFFGRHITKRELVSAFNINTALPWKSGIGAIEPTGYIDIASIVKVAFVAVLALLLVHAVINMTKLERTIFDNQYHFTDSSDTVSAVSNKFVLEKPSSNIQLKIFAPVDNNWFELAATLVDANTGKEYAVSQGVEYYYGYSDGESWTEGDRNQDVYINGVPEGTYFLQIQGQRENASRRIDYFEVRAIYDVPTYRNIFLSLLLLILWPLGKLIFVNYKEKKRWENSPYLSPYANQYFQ